MKYEIFLKMREWCGTFGYALSSGEWEKFRWMEEEDEWLKEQFSSLRSEFLKRADERLPPRSS